METPAAMRVTAAATRIRAPAQAPPADRRVAIVAPAAARARAAIAGPVPGVGRAAVRRRPVGQAVATADHRAATVAPAVVAVARVAAPVARLRGVRVAATADC